MSSNILVNKKIAFFNKQLFLAVGDYRRKNGVGKKSVISIEIASHEFKTMIDYPQKYFRCDVRDSYPIVEIDSGKIISVFLKDDEIGLWNIGSGRLEKRSGHNAFVNDFMCYNANTNGDLAYASRYDLNDELNVSLLKFRNKYVLVKRLRKASKKDPSRIAFLVYDKDLKYVKTIYPKESLFPQCIFESGDRIIALSHDWSKIVLYEV